MISAIILFSIFLSLAAIHISWALGSSWAINEAIPTNENGEAILNPSKKDSAMVGTGLLLFGVFYLIKGDILVVELPIWAMNIASWMIPSLFLFRSIGDFKYVGFFKKVRKTSFAEKDSIFYSPLCMIIAIIGFIIELA